MNKFKDIFKKINYIDKTLLIDQNCPFFKELLKRIVDNNSNEAYYYVIKFLCLWTFQDLINIFKQYCNSNDIEEFLKEYPDFLEFMI